MKRIFLIHGWTGTPEYGWYPWLREELKKAGHEVIVPLMPNTENPVVEEWVETLKNLVGTPDLNTYFIGQSIGCQAILRYLETINAQVGGAVFVAGWFNLDNLEDEETVQVAKPWIEHSFDIEKIRHVLPTSTLLISDNDPFGCFEENKKKFAEIGSDIVVIPGAGHFAVEDGYMEIPEVLKYL